jgi:hypothetical protein
MARFRIAAGLAAMFAAGLFVCAPASAESIMKQCGDEWKAAKAANATKGQTWRDFLKDCRTRHAEAPAATTTTAAPAPAPAAEPAPAPKPAATRMSRTPHTTAGEFASEGEAKGHCPTDQVVWVNNRSHKYHYSGDRYYGATKHGAYMCEGEAKAAGDSAAKNSKPKS